MKSKNEKWIFVAPNGGFIPVIIGFSFSLIMIVLGLIHTLTVENSPGWLVSVFFSVWIPVTLFLAVKFFLIKIINAGDRIIAKGLFGTITEIEKSSLKISFEIQYDVSEDGRISCSKYYILEDRNRKCKCQKFFRTKKNEAIVILSRKKSEAFIKEFYDKPIMYLGGKDRPFKM